MKKQTGLPKAHEQRKVEKLLIKLAKVRPIDAKPTPIVNGRSTRRSA